MDTHRAVGRWRFAEGVGCFAKGVLAVLTGR